MTAGWDKIDCLMGGTKAMRAAGTRYLPQWPREDQASYDFRISTSTLFNALARTVGNMSAKPFSEPLKWSDIDAKVEAWFDNIDLAGRNFHVFAQEIFRTGMMYGLTHVLVDLPRAAGVKTLADERAAGIRPYLVQVTPKRVLGWKTGIVEGVETLAQLRFTESVKEDDGDFGAKDVEQIRVLTPGEWQTYRKTEKGEWVLFEKGVTTFNFIPLVTYYANRTGFMTGTPVLEDLADLNIKHWQSSSDQDSILHTARVPILAISGVTDDDKIIIGAKSALMLPMGADAKFVEHSGAAIAAGHASLQDLEEQMRLMGAELLVSKPGIVTATQSSIDTAQQQCQLSAMASILEDTLDQAVDIMAEWAGLGDQGDIDVFDDFGAAAVTGVSETMLMQATNSGLLSNETFFAEMQRRGIVNADIEWPEEQARIGRNPPMPSGAL